MAEIKIKIDTNLQIMQQKLAAVSKDKWPKILASAANETGFYLINKYKQQMPQYIDRPKPFTLNALYVRKAIPGKAIDATVEFRDRGGKANFPGHYLIPQVEGGSRSPKRFERALMAFGLMPSGHFAVPSPYVKLDAFGNVPGGYITRLLSYLSADRSSTQQRGAGKRTRNKARTYLAVWNGVAHAGRGESHPTTLAPGLYEKHSKEKKIYQIFHYVKQLTFKKRFPWYDIGEKAAQEKFPSKLDEAIAKALKENK